MSEQAEKDKPIRAKVIWPNVWSSQGKHLKGDVVDFSPEDFALLDERDAVKRAR